MSSINGPARKPVVLDAKAVKQELASFDADSKSINDGLAAGRAFFRKLGVTEKEGIGPLSVQIKPDIFDASYQAKTYRQPDGTVKRIDERIEVGRNPYTGTSFGQAHDVLIHELAHRVNEHIVPGLGVSKTSRILDESLADTFAAAADGNWTIGEALLPDGGLRSLADPSKQRTVTNGDIAWAPTATTFSQITQASVDASPYPNIGPLNNAAYRIGTKLGTDTMAELYLHTLRNHLTSESGPTELVVGTIKSAGEMFGTGSTQQNTVRDAWKAVGVRPAAVDSVK